MKPSLIAPLAIIASLSVNAVEPDFSGYTPEEIVSLQPETRSKVPLVYLWAARDGHGDGSELLLGRNLNALMYPGLSDYQAAIKQYQADLGEKPTGKLTVSQIATLKDRYDFQKLSYVHFPQSYSHYQMKTVASVKGTMIIQDERIASPINHVEITCYKNPEYCEFEQVSLVTPKEDDWTRNYSVEKQRSDIYTITRWVDGIIDAVPSDTEDQCRVTALNLNFKTQEFYQITRNGTGSCAFGEFELPKLTKPRIAQIIDGKDVIKQEFRLIEQQAFEMLSSEYQTKVKKYMDDYNSKSSNKAQ